MGFPGGTEAAPGTKPAGPTNPPAPGPPPSPGSAGSRGERSPSAAIAAVARTNALLRGALGFRTTRPRPSLADYSSHVRRTASCGLRRSPGWERPCHVLGALFADWTAARGPVRAPLALIGQQICPSSPFPLALCSRLPPPVTRLWAFHWLLPQLASDSVPESRCSFPLDANQRRTDEAEKQGGWERLIHVTRKPVLSLTEWAPAHSLIPVLRPHWSSLGMRHHVIKRRSLIGQSEALSYPSLR